MTPDKWYRSYRIYAIILTVLALILKQCFGIEISAEQQDQMAKLLVDLAEVVIPLMTIVLTAASKVRERAKTTQGKTDVDTALKSALLVVLLGWLTMGCGLYNLTPAERNRTLCADAMSQYTSMYNESVRLTSDKATPSDTKRFIVEEVNPKLNGLHRLIVAYCDDVLAEGAPSYATIETTIAELTNLFIQVRSRHE